MRTSLTILLLGLLVAGCRPQGGKEASQVLLERQTPVTVTTNTGLEGPGFPLKCEAVGFDGLNGAFEPVMLLTSPLPRGASGTRSIGSGWSETVKVYRGTNRVAASNQFLGEFEVSGFASGEEKSRVQIGFNLNAQRELFLYASDERGMKQYNVRLVGASVKP